MHVLLSALSRFTSPSGICRHAANLANGLSQCDEIDRVTFVTGAWQQDYFRESLGVRDSAKLKFATVPVHNSSAARNIWFLRTLPKLATDLRCDVAHLSFPVPILRHSFPCKTVVSLHDLYPYDYPEVFGFPNVFFNRYFLGLCLNNCDSIAAVSNTTRARAEVLFPRVASKLRMVPNIAERNPVSSFRPVALRFDRFLLTVAQHRANKNLPLAVRAFHRLMTESILSADSGFVIVGCRGPETASLEAEIRSCGLQDRVQLMESIPDSELQWLYQNCTLFIVTSSTEGFCLPLVEAMACGCKIICSDIPTLREIGAMNCEFFPLSASPYDAIVQAAVTAMSAVRTDPSFDFLQAFAPSIVCKQYLNIYRGLLESTRKPDGNPASAVLVP
jgi:glycosyltransferase involved in cell wall biosynthesis